MRQQLRCMSLIPVVLLATGCATKGWVRETLGQHATETNQRLGEASQRVDRVEVRVNEQSQSMKNFETNLGDTRQRADAAFTKADATDARLTRLWSGRLSRTLVDTIDVHFAFNRWDLNDGAETALLPVIKELQADPRLTLDLEGYTDRIGNRVYNIDLSQRRVEAVRRFLVHKGVELSRIHAIGLGPDSARQGRAQQRRVTVKLMAFSE